MHAFIRFCALPLLVASLLGCGLSKNVRDTSQAQTSESVSVFKTPDALGQGIQFFNAAPEDTAMRPEQGAEYAYSRQFSANSRVSPVGIEIWIFDRDGQPIHQRHAPYLRDVYSDIYGWSPSQWKEALGDSESAKGILTAKSDLFWESLAQHLAERVFGERISPFIQLFGLQCQDGSASECGDEGVADAHRVVVRTYLDGRRDPMNPVTRSIVYSVERGHITDSQLIFQLEVPNGIRVAGPHGEHLDFRPMIAGRQDALVELHLWALLPRGRRSRSRNEHYPDYNLIFVPLRHLVLQGNVDDPKKPGSSFDYPDQRTLIKAISSMVSELRHSEGGQRVAHRLEPFLNDHYYYMFADGGQRIDGYRGYILGKTAGIGRGLSPDFGRIELVSNGTLLAVFDEAPDGARGRETDPPKGSE